MGIVSKLENEFGTFINLNEQVPTLIKKLRDHYKNKSLKSLVDLYYELLGKINVEKSNRNYEKMIMNAQMSLGLIEPLIIANKVEYGTFDLKSIPAFEVSLPHYAVTGAKGQIKNIEEIVDNFPELLPWREEVERAKEMNQIASKLYNYIKENSGTLQKKLKKEIGYDDGKIIANTLIYMELNNIIKREKSGNTYKLFLIEINS